MTMALSEIKSTNLDFRVGGNPAKAMFYLPSTTANFPLKTMRATHALGAALRLPR